MKKMVIGLIIMSYCLMGTYVLGDGIDNYTVLMLHSDGGQGSNNFIDDSSRGHAIIPNNPFIDTSQKKFGTGSIFFDGVDDYLSIPYSTDWDLLGSALDDWTVDFWVKHGDHLGEEYYINQYLDGNSLWEIRHQQGIGIRFNAYNGGVLVASIDDVGVITDADWHHIALCKAGSSYRLYKDGLEIGSTSDSDTAAFQGDLYIGAVGRPNHYFSGWMDEIRISKGITRWASDFTPPIESYNDIITPPISSTFLLGDFDLNGRVDIEDGNTFTSCFGNRNMGYLQGDITGDGKVHIDDFAILRGNYDVDNRIEGEATSLYHGDDIILTLYPDGHKEVHVYQGRGFFTMDELLDASLIDPGDFMIKTYTNGAQLTFDRHGWPVLNSMSAENPEALEAVLTDELLEGFVETSVAEEDALVDNSTIQGDQEILAKLAVAEELFATRNTKDLTYYNELKSKSKYLDWLKS